MSKLRILSPRNDRDFERAVDLTFEVFGGFGQPREQTVSWLNFIGRENVRLGWMGERAVCGLAILPFGQWFGGRSVSSAGISAVVVAPDVRGAGVGTRFIRGAMTELANSGFALSVLYPSTYGLYRKAGFEPAGSRILYRAEVTSFGVREHSLAVRPYEPDDLQAVRGVHEFCARRTAGNVDRTPENWRRILEYGADRKYAYVVEGKKGVEGYVIYTVSMVGQHPSMRFNVRDMAASTPAAARRLLTYFADHATMAESVVWNGGLADPMLVVAKEERFHVDARVLWMLRILNVKAALEARGYPPRLTTEASFEIEDDLFTDNCGRFVLRVENGRGSVRRGGKGRVKTSIRGLAPLYSGHLTARALQLAGLVDGPDEDLAALDALFGGVAPWMNDRF